MTHTFSKYGDGMALGELSGFLNNQESSDRCDRITKTPFSENRSTTKRRKKEKKRGISWLFWHLTFSFKLNKTPPCKDLLSPLKIYVWALTSDRKRRSLKHLCCDCWRHDPSPAAPPRPRTCIPPIPSPNGADCFHIHAGSKSHKFVSHCGSEDMSLKVIIWENESSNSCYNDIPDPTNCYKYLKSVLMHVDVERL